LEYIKNNTDVSAVSLLAIEGGHDPIKERLLENIRATIKAVFAKKLEAFLGRLRYDRGTDKPQCHRNGRRELQFDRHVWHRD